MNVRFNGWNCIVSKRTYPNGRVALQLIDAEDGCPIATCTINLPDTELEDSDDIIVKDYSENEGIYVSLRSAGIISEPYKYVKSGFVTNIPVCKLLVQL